MITDLRAVFDWLADWPTQAGEHQARDSMLWPWNLLEKRLQAAMQPGWVRAWDQAYRAETRNLTKRADTFTHINPDAVTAMRRESAQLVRDITQEQRRIVQQLLAQSYSDGEAWTVIARRLATVVGPTRRQAESVQRLTLDREARMIADGYTPAEARDRALQLGLRYRNRLVRQRTRTIARTETTRANALARRAAWRDADAQGRIPAGSRLEWLSYDPCDVCAALNGTQVPYTQGFPDGDPPRHPNCRCVVLLITPR